MELLGGDSEICLIELVRDVPADGSKLTTLLDKGVEEAQPIQHLLEGFLQQQPGMQVRN